MSSALFAAAVFVLVLLLALWHWLSRATRQPRRSPADSLPRAPLQPGGGDDLKQIKGVGKVIESRLHALGITSFEQIARFTPEDIERVDKVLDFKGRIQRERWIEQARELAKINN